ncbi:MAG: DUF3291 domain-containing protein [Chloroflexi bacterium]|nr:DUF3291 domain-containing protein [Chloroflexota bacterium]MYC02646.1 DUF3291 domain-containing protein [Chloroflexota bacterium]
MAAEPSDGVSAQQERREAGATVVATRLQLRGWRKLCRFFQVNRAVERQLRADPGLVSYRLRADFIRLRFSTMSIWTGDEPIDGFVWTGNHLGAVNAFDEIAVRERSAFVRWQTANPDDVTWSECRERLAAKERSS